ncbi:alkaline phosphatase family protein [Hyperthermus butylicus]|uniref:Conserved archaeal protein n=1 Tax=Hyperthermus butylicus (strain DSM 5456 / JCM 9403 / PLM1-5) TaxID=415426 RepID=A2BMW3_HYPBU|nr:alkaline phosphatase family protein [Hyperthermus butylicus]ABM81324.1 conserved archaeal protein [Hyperthermus butylicus DSM 5456]
MARKVFILGLDSMPPKVLYEGMDGGGFQYLRRIVEESSRYILETCHPPITVPAWMVMFTGKTPGELGIYGFRHRKPGEFGYYIVNSSYIKYPTIWDEAGRRGLRVGVYGVPPTYPPRPVHGFLVTDFTTPGPEKPYTFPPWLRRELEHVAGPTVFDIVYRSHDKQRVARDLFHMLENHQRQVEYLATRKQWDLFIYVEIAVDRAHHAFWKYFDKSHPRYTEHPEYSRVIPELYRRIDEWFEKLHKNLPRDTVIVIASDHGIKPMKGAFTINQWLMEQGYLKLKVDPGKLKPGTDLEEDMIDWEHTIAWAWGGYYSRVFINLKGREKRGTVEPKYYEETVKQLKRDIEKITGPNGEQWRNMAHQPEELYPIVRGDAPDLMVYLDNLDWRPAGTLGWQTMYLPENDRGPDDAVHDWHGVLAIYDPEGTIDRGDKGVIGIEKVYNLLRETLISKD